VSDRSPEQAPHGVAGEPDCEEPEQDVTEWLTLDCAESTLLVRDPAALTDDEVESEQPDDAVDERTRDEAAARENLERAGLDEPGDP
jgi:hypothetical protein